jgi:hypothetical protein
MNDSSNKNDTVTVLAMTVVLMMVVKIDNEALTFQSQLLIL